MNQSLCRLAVVTFLSSLIFTGSGIAGEVELFSNLRLDPRSPAMLNLTAAKRAISANPRRLGSFADQRTIGTTTVNNPAADTTEADTQMAATLVDLGGGKLVAAFNDSGSMASGSHFTGYSYSSNNGMTWTDAGTLPASGEGDGGGPVLAHHKASGAVYLATFGFVTFDRIQVFKSTDFGHTFGAPVNGTPGTLAATEFQDSPHIAVDNFSGTGNGRVYLCRTRIHSDGITTGAEIRFSRSANGGASFGPSGGVLISTGGQGCHVVVSPNHQVNILYYRGDGFLGQGGDNKLAGSPSCPKFRSRI